MHDLKTLNSQLSLMVQNAEKHKDNPAFVEDMISTTEHVVNKMTFLLEHFQSNTKAGAYQVSKVDLVKVVNEVVAGQTKLRPWPVLTCDRDSIEVMGSHAELESSIGHLVQNAQEATADDHSVEIDLTVEENVAVLTIEDSGSGMTDEFINTRLFKPFTSTKGTTGMGIGVYQCRSTVRKLKGDLRVQSQLGKGSKFTITLPLHDGH